MPHTAEYRIVIDFEHHKLPDSVAVYGFEDTPSGQQGYIVSTMDVGPFDTKLDVYTFLVQNLLRDSAERRYRFGY